ncbi:MAG: Pyridoxine/pyridoxamine 5-phosphate oxidase [Acidobacteriota bacterium]|jgi:pyridoxamine 5'-phosphate oxidase
MSTLADLRRDYASRALDEHDADPNPMRQFSIWFDEALRSQLLDTNAMTLATASASGEPAARIVLLKGADDAGFVFYTNYDSHKGRDLTENPRACLLLFWAELERQVRITGSVSRTSREESEAYFHSRPIESQIGATISRQSRAVADRSEIEARYAAVAATLADGKVPLPSNWGGYRVAPHTIEFWQGRKSRLHDRLLYSKQADGSWSRARLEP